MSKVEDIFTVDDFEAALNNRKIVVNFSGLYWCVPCQQMKPHYVKVAEATDGVDFYYIDIDTIDPALPQRYGVSAVPTVLVFENGEVVNRMTGFTPAPKLIAGIGG